MADIYVLNNARHAYDFCVWGERENAVELANAHSSGVLQNLVFGIKNGNTYITV